MDAVAFASVVEVVAKLAGGAVGGGLVFDLFGVPDVGTLAGFDEGAGGALDEVVEDFFDGLFPGEVVVSEADPGVALEGADEAAAFGDEADAGDAEKDLLEIRVWAGGHDVDNVLGIFQQVVDQVENTLRARDDVAVWPAP